MGIALPDKWIWDSWYVRDGDLWHAFFLQADNTLPDPEMRHWNVTYGHATSRDLTNWEHLGTCFTPSKGPAFDDYTIWTGSVVRGDDDLWHLFYTGTSRADGGLYQRLGLAVSEDLHNWQRIGEGPLIDRSHDAYEEYVDGHWHDRAFRDPWVMRDPSGKGWLMYFTARRAGVAEKNSAGAIGFATSRDLKTWTLEEPIFTGAAGHLEVPQVFERGGRWYCLFCTDVRFWDDAARQRIGNALSGTHYLIADNPRGPWELAPGPMLDGATPFRRYAARIVDEGDEMRLLGFRWFDHEGGPFVGQIADPQTVVTTPDGRLTLSDPPILTE